MRPRRNAHANRPAADGMTLIEATVSIVIVGVMMVAALSTMGSAARAGRIHQARCIGSNLARDLMAEILQASYCDPNQPPVFGPESSEGTASRAGWDDVDDYRDWSASPPQTRGGTTLSWAAGWTRKSTVELVRLSDPTRTTSSDEGLKRVTVTVIGPQAQTFTLQALRGSASVYDQEPRVQTTYVSRVGIDLQIGPSSASRVATGTDVVNFVPVPQ